MKSKKFKGYLWNFQCGALQSGALKGTQSAVILSNVFQLRITVTPLTDRFGFLGVANAPVMDRFSMFIHRLTELSSTLRPLRWSGKHDILGSHLSHKRELPQSCEIPKNAQKYLLPTVFSHFETPKQQDFVNLKCGALKETKCCRVSQMPLFAT